jgi:hypothetical protein
MQYNFSTLSSNQAAVIKYIMFSLISFIIETSTIFTVKFSIKLWNKNKTLRSKSVLPDAQPDNNFKLKWFMLEWTVANIYARFYK